MSDTPIEWTDTTWNPVRGCSMAKGSELGGCLNCYAARNQLRRPHQVSGNGKPFSIMAGAGPRWSGKVELVESKLYEPLHWRKPRRVFVNSMSDLGHESLPDADILSVFQVMGKCPRQTFQVLTKRAANLGRVLSGRRWRNLGYSPEMAGDVYTLILRGEHRPDDSEFLPNVWLGVSVENQPTADERIPELLRTPAALRFVSYEPALAGVDFTRYLQPHWTPGRGADLPPWLDWGIIGGESGPGARPFQLEWAESTVHQFGAAGVPLFVKQLGANPRQGCFKYACELDPKKGGNPADWPRTLRVRQFPPTVTALPSAGTGANVVANP